MDGTAGSFIFRDGVHCETLCQTEIISRKAVLHWTIESISNSDLSQEIIVSPKFSSKALNEYTWQAEFSSNLRINAFLFVLRLEVNGEKTGQSGTYSLTFLDSNDTELKKFSGTLGKLKNGIILSKSIPKLLLGLRSHKATLPDDLLKIHVQVSVYGGTVHKVKYPDTDAPLSSPILHNYVFNLYSSGKFSDCVIKVLNKNFGAHKVVLASQSKVFEAMFHYGLTNGLSTIEIQDAEPECVELLLRYMYSGEKPNFMTAEQAEKLYKLATDYCVDGLIEICRSFLLRKQGNVIS